LDKFPFRESAAAVSLEPRVTAVVVVRNAGRSLELCLRAALNEPWIDELVIVDCGNPAPMSSALRALHADRRDVLLVEFPDNLSLAAAANMGASKARGRWLLFLDSHVVLQRGAVMRMAAAGGVARTPWIVGGRLTDPNGRERQGARMGALNVWSALAVAMALPGKRPVRRRRGLRPEEAEPAKVSAVSGALMLMPSADFHDLGGFDEGFATDAADLDLCRRAGEAGGSVLFEPAASGVQVAPSRGKRRPAQGLARFAVKSARTPFERGLAFLAAPVLALFFGLRDFVGGRPPHAR